MKKLIAFAFVIILPFFCYGSGLPKTKEITVGIHFQAGFKNDSVQVFLNDTLKYTNQKVTTRDPGRLDIADATEFKVKVKDNFSDINIVKIIVNKKCILELDVNFLKSRWFGISKKDDHALLAVSDNSFVYM